jgi:hypothetical protein
MRIPVGTLRETCLRACFGFNYDWRQIEENGLLELTQSLV